jgi:outer membrane protein
MSRNGRAAWLAAVCVAAISGPAWAETLAEAVALAYQTNPALRGQRAQLRGLDEGILQARAGYAPRVSLGVNARVEDSLDGATQRNQFTGRNVGELDTGTDSLDASLTVDQAIYTGGRTAAAIDSARADVEAGREQLRQVETNVLLNVISAYVDIRRDQEALRIRSENLDVLRRQVDETRARFEVGEITRTDVAQAEQRLAQSEGTWPWPAPLWPTAARVTPRWSGRTRANSRPNPASPVCRRRWRKPTPSRRPKAP